MTVKSRLAKLERLPQSLRSGWRSLAYDLNHSLWRILGSKGPEPTWDDIPDTKAEFDAFLDQALAGVYEEEAEQQVAGLSGE